MIDKDGIFSETNQQKFDQLSRSWSRMVDCIGHDLSTPIAILRMAGENLENVFPKLMEGYRLAVKNNLIKSDLTESDLEHTESSVPEISKDITYISNFLRSLHPYQQKLFLNPQEIKFTNIVAILKDALKNYYFTQENERSLFHIDFSYDFEFSCDPIFIKYLFHNLFDDALNHIRRAGKGEINISTKNENHYNVIYFKNTANGMDEYSLSRVFNRFFSKYDNEIVPGLGFCRLALLQQGGDILCDSPKKEYTEFIIKFPKV